MINTCLIQQYDHTPMAYVYKEKTQNEILISDIIQEPFWRLNTPVLEGSITKDHSQISENEDHEKQSSASEKSSEQAHPREDETTEDCESSAQDQSEQEQEDDYQIAHPFTHSGAVILTKQEMNLKFEQLPEDAALWIEEDGKKRKIELTQEDLSISLHTDLVKATLVDAKGNVLRKWSILCLAQEDGSIQDLILDGQEELQDSQSSALPDSHDNDSSTQLEESLQNDASGDSSVASDSNESNDPAKDQSQSAPEQANPPQEDGSKEPQIQQLEPIEAPTVSQQTPAESPPKQDAALNNHVDPSYSATTDNDQISAENLEKSEIKLSVDQKTYSTGQKVFTQNLADVQLVVSQGTILSMEVISQNTKHIYGSIQEAAKAEQSGTFEIKVTVLDQNVQRQAHWTVIQVGGAIATSKTTQGKKVDVVYQMNGQGEFSAQSKSQNQNIQLYRKFEPLNNDAIQSGEQLRLYLDKDPGVYQVQINGQQADVDMEKDELGQAYLPIEAKTGKNSIQLFKDGQEVFSQEIFANATRRLNSLLIAGGALAVALTIVLIVVKRRGQVCG